VEKRGKATYNLSEISCFCHVAEQPNFDHTCEHFYSREELMVKCIAVTEVSRRAGDSSNCGKTNYLQRMLHIGSVEWRVDDEITIVADNGSGLGYGHPQLSIRRT
jgi:hypothetical protein